MFINLSRNLRNFRFRERHHNQEIFSHRIFCCCCLCFGVFFLLFLCVFVGCSGAILTHFSLNTGWKVRGKRELKKWIIKWCTEWNVSKKRHWKISYNGKKAGFGSQGQFWLNTKLHALKSETNKQISYFSHYCHD